MDKQSVTPPRTSPINKRLLSIVTLLSFLVMPGSFAQEEEGNASTSTAKRVFFASGIRVGEVTQTGAIVWTRLTEFPQRNWDGIIPDPPTSPTRVNVKTPNIPVHYWEGAVPGASGEVRLVISVSPEMVNARYTDWTPVFSNVDYTHKFQLKGLTPAVRYFIHAEGRQNEGGPVEKSTLATFTTAPKADEWHNISFTVISCQMYYHREDKEGFRIYPAMSRLDPPYPHYPDFVISTGDSVYYDRDNPRARTVDLCRLPWQRMYSLPWVMEFHKFVPGYWEKDDHDTFFDDCWRSCEAPWISPLTYEQGEMVFKEQNPVPNSLFRTVQWGQGVQIWLTDSRDFRSANDSKDGPEKTLWGEENKQWLQRSILESDAAFRILVSPTAIVGPDNADQEDSHANPAFGHEGNEFRRWTLEQNLSNFYVINGDRHWQYMSTDPATGLREFSHGPASDMHAFTGPGEDPAYHSFYRSGGGFLSVTVRRGSQKVLAHPQRILDEEGIPTILLRFHDVDGNVLYEYRDTVLLR